MASQQAREWDAVKKSVEKSLLNHFQFQAGSNTLYLDDVEISTSKAQDDYGRQKKAILSRGTYAVPVYGHVVLKNTATGEIKDRKKIKLFTLPVLTTRGTYVVGGNEYNFFNQARRKPGVFIRKFSDERKGAEFNLARGRNFRIHFDPKKGTLYVEFISPKAKVGLYPLLKVMGVSDSEFSKRFDKDILANSKTLFDGKEEREAEKFLSRLDYEKPENAGKELRALISEKVGRVDPHIVAQTLGIKTGNITPEVLMRAAEELIKFRKGKRKADDWNSWHYKSFHDVKGFFNEYLRKHNKPKIRGAFRKIERSLVSANSVDDVMPRPSILNSAVRGFFTTDVNLSAPLPQTNVVSVIDGSERITFMGEGGIGDELIAKKDIRDNHPSVLGFVDPLKTTDDKVGLVHYKNPKTFVQGDRLFTKVKNVKTGKQHTKSLEFFKDHWVALPNMKGKGTKIWAVKNNKVELVSKTKVSWSIPTVGDMYSPSMMAIPFLNSNEGVRMVYGARMLGQALALTDPEKPLVSSVFDTPTGRKSLEKFYVDRFIPRASGPGKVTKIDRENGYIHLISPNNKPFKVSFYANYPLNQKSLLDTALSIKVGDQVVAGQNLGEINFSKGGELAIGRNLKTAYIPYKGWNFEDAIVISDTASNKLSAEQGKKIVIDLEEVKISKKTFAVYQAGWVSRFGIAFNNLDSDGIIKKGAKIKYGEPLFVGLKKRTNSEGDYLTGLASKSLKSPYMAKIKTWEEDAEGEVVAVQKSGNRLTVVVKYHTKVKVGDKLANRFGGKGVVSLILPDDDMPRTKDGNPTEILLSPATIVTRKNPGQLFELATAKVAKKLGVPIQISNFGDKDNLTLVKNLMAQENVSDKEELFDANGESLGNIVVGPSYIMRLEKKTTENYSARSAAGTPPGNWHYDEDKRPVKSRGAGGGAKNVGSLTLYAMMSHNAKNFLRDAATYKGEKNDEFWRAYMLGHPLPPPKVPFTTDKLMAMLRGAGIDAKKEGSTLKLVPFTDKEIDTLSYGEIKEPKLLVSTKLGLKPEVGGLFDPAKTGGPQGTKWSHIKLTEPIVNPMFQKPVAHLLDITEKELTQTMAVQGGYSISKALAKIGRDKEISRLEELLKTEKRITYKNKYSRNLKYLKALKDMKLQPKDAYMLSKIPVLPPVMRPVYDVKQGELRVADPNYLYQDLIAHSDNLKEAKKLGEELGLTADARRGMIKAVKVVQGLDSPESPHLKERKVEGFLKRIAGLGGPKTGFFHKKVISKAQDLSGRATIASGPNLNLDEAEIPKEMAWTLFSPFVMKNLTARGYKALDAFEQVSNKTPAAQVALEDEMTKRPIILNRAPSLHKFSVMSFKPKLGTDDKTIRIPNMVVKGFNADFDGNSVNSEVLIRFKVDFDTKKPELCYNAGMINAEVNTPTRIHISNFPHTGKVTKKSERMVEYEVPKEVEMLSFNEDTRVWEWKTVTRFSVHENLKNWIVKYKSGRELHCSDDVSLYVIPKGELRPVRQVPTDSVGCLSPNPNLIDIKPSIERVIVSGYNKTDKHRGYSLKTDVVKLDRNFGWFVGLMAGDGWTNIGSKKGAQPYGICLANSDFQISEKYAEVTERLVPGRTLTVVESPHDFKGHASYSEKRTFCCEDLAWFLHVNLGKGAYNKKLPPFILETPEEFRWGVLSGLMDSDGTFCWCKAKSKPKPQFMGAYFTMSKELKDGFSMLCWSLGIRTSITKSRGGYHLFLRTHDVKNNIGNFSVVHTDKVASLERLKGYELSFDQTDYLPFTTEEALEVSRAYWKKFKDDTREHREELGISHKRYCTEVKTPSSYAVWRRISTQNKVCRHTLKKAVRDFPDLFKSTEIFREIKEILDSGITYDRVTKIEKQEGRTTMWDVTIPGSRTFLSADGVAIFDTMQIHVPLTDEAVQDAWDMTPGKNLFAVLDKNPMNKPEQDAVLGLWKGTTPKSKGVKKVYDTVQNLLKDYRAGLVKPDDVVEVKEIEG